MIVLATTRSEVLATAPVVARSSALTDLAGLLRALGDPTRLAITAILAHENGPLCVCYLEARFDLSQPTISHHLRVLREVGLVTTEKRGTWIYYALDRGRLGRAPGLDALLASVTPKRARRKACCP